MQFNSLRFFLFFACVLALHRLLRPRWRNGLLLLASWVFYAICGPRFLPLLLVTTALNFLLAKPIAAGRHRKALLVVGLLLNFGALFLLKYLTFFGQLVSGLLHTLGLGPVAVPSLLLPVGISFYTFVVCGYLMDVYRGTSRPETNFVDFALLVSFFPALLSGPIERSTTLLPQIRAHRLPGSDATGEDVKTGVSRFLIGLAKKMILADQLAVLVNTAYAAPESFTGMQLLAAALAYSLQIYCDFSAYSDMAVGCGRLLGFRLTENFNAPYLARSVKDFWRRWHISLSSWFRDYLYFPLGGSRKGALRTDLNVLIVFAVSGLWHGAAMTFVIWGLLNGLYQVIGKLLLPLKKRIWAALHLSPKSRFLAVVQIAITFCLLTVTWIFFRAGSIQQALTILGRICTMAGGVFPLAFTSLGMGRKQLAALAVCVLALILWDIRGQKSDLVARINQTVWRRYAVWTCLVLAILLLGAYGTGYNAQEFVYFQF